MFMLHIYTPSRASVHAKWQPTWVRSSGKIDRLKERPGDGKPYEEEFDKRTTKIVATGEWLNGTLDDAFSAEIVNAGYIDDSEGLSAKFDSKGKVVAAPALADDEDMPTLVDYWIDSDSDDESVLSLSDLTALTETTANETTILTYAEALSSPAIMAPMVLTVSDTDWLSWALMERSLGVTGNTKDRLYRLLMHEVHNAQQTPTSSDRNDLNSQVRARLAANGHNPFGPLIAATRRYFDQNLDDLYRRRPGTTAFGLNTPPAAFAAAQFTVPNTTVYIDDIAVTAGREPPCAPISPATPIPSYSPLSPTAPPISPDRDENRGRTADDDGHRKSGIEISYRTAMFLIVFNVAMAAITAGVSISTVVEAAKQFLQLTVFLFDYFI